jgi:hypothetical protein
LKCDCTKCAYVDINTIEEKDKQYIVMLHKGTMLVFQLKTLFSNKKLEVNGYIYTKNYKIK